MLSTIKLGLRSAFRRSGVTLRTKVEGQAIYYNPGTDIGWRLLVRGKFERTEIDICRRFIGKDAVVVDIGANIGLHSVAFSKSVPHGTVVAVEASPSTYVQLLRNVRHLDNVVALNAALSAQCGLTEFFVASDNAYSSLKDTGLKAVQKKIQVPCYTGDYLIGPILKGRLDFLKIDVEGLETEVIRGLMGTIKQYRPTIFCEIYGGHASNPEPSKTISLVASVGYRPYVINRDKLIAFERHDDRNYNYLFVPEEKLAIYPFLPAASG